MSLSNLKSFQNSVFRTPSILLLALWVVFPACHEVEKTSAEPHTDKVIQGNSPWDGSSGSYCNLQPNSHSKMDLTQTREDQLKTISKARIQQLAKEGKLQEAIWILAAQNTPDSLKVADRWKSRLHQTLSEKKVEIIPKSLGGSTKKYYLEFEKGYGSVFKSPGEVNPNGYWWADTKAEVAAYELDQLIGANVVPMTVLRRLQDEEGSLQYFMKDLPFAKNDATQASNFGALKVMDYLTGNVDRKTDNTLYWPEMAWVVAIDNGAGFKNFECGDPAVAVEYLHELPHIKERIQNLKDTDVRSSLFHYLPEEAMDRTIHRIHLLQDALCSFPSDDIRTPASNQTLVPKKHSCHLNRQNGNLPLKK